MIKTQWNIGEYSNLQNHTEKKELPKNVHSDFAWVLGLTITKLLLIFL